MQAIGVDLIEIERVMLLAKKYPSFLSRFFTKQEILLCQQKSSFYASLAARFAAKEAVSKALGKNLFSFCWQEIEILADATNKPYIILHGNLQKEAQQAKIKNWLISLSHSRHLAIAMVAVE